MIDDWSDEFIPRELRDNIIQLDGPDHHEREGYTVNLAQGNYENDLQAAQDAAAQDQSFDPNNSRHFLTGSVSTGINGERQNPDVRMLDTLLDVLTNGPRPSEQCDIENPDSIYRLSLPRQQIPQKVNGLCVVFFAYLEATIVQGIDDTIPHDPHDPQVNLPSAPPSTKEMETDVEFFLRLSCDRLCGTNDPGTF
ncbi:hypothetical protein PEX2_052270 [Penicillium expansum]|uniref:Uncharacterized protein n=1 Tax=Penicillium expansum TaxID=27334 RepID=A0A0A2JAH4_PENEN|nr:hypothetical protein PEX2_052270 [Penicillium expansum]KGO49340.1 hypothetical protein PEX2_052270 [Penicillium expansum]